MNRSSVLALVISISLIAACGGGGGGGTGSASDTTGAANQPAPSSGSTGGTPPTSPANEGPAQEGTSGSGSTPPGTTSPGTPTTPVTPGDPATPATPTEPTTPPPATVDTSKALAARFNMPRAIATDIIGTFYITDNGTVRKIAPTGEVTTIAGTAGQFGPPSGGNDGTGAAARFNIISSITVGSGGNLYVTDTVTNTGRIRRITPAGVVTTILNDVYGLGITSNGAGDLFFTNNFSSTIGVVRADGTTGRIADVREPRGITVDNAGNLYVTNTGLDYGPLGQNTFSCTIEKISPSGQVSTLAGSFAVRELDNTCGSTDGKGAAARIGSMAHGIAVDSAGNAYFADTSNHTIRKVTSDGTVTTIAGMAGSPGTTDGTGTAARFNGPRGITMGRDGNLYVADTQNHAIRKVTPSGVVTTFAGKAGESGSTDVPQ